MGLFSRKDQDQAGAGDGTRPTVPGLDQYAAA